MKAGIVAAVAAVATATVAVATFLLGYVPGTDPYHARLARENVRSALLDPTSALFQNVKVVKLHLAGLDGRPGICAEVNGKNTGGAYTGFHRVIALAALEKDSVYFEPIVMRSQEEAQQLRADCRREVEAAKQNPFGAIIGQFTCQQSLEAAKEQLAAAQFQLAWDLDCEGKANDGDKANVAANSANHR